MPPISVVSGVVMELNGTGAGPFTIYDVSNVTSGVIYQFLEEADATLRQWVGAGPSNSSSGTTTWQMARRFELNYASAKLLASIAGIIVTDGFNYSLGGLDVQRVGAKFQTYEMEIRTRLQITKQIVNQLHEWFLIYTPDNPQGVNERGAPVTYWSTSNPRY